MGSAEDVTVREYRRGDDLRRVHWRSSARVGELMVRREEQPWQSRATVFLDNRARSHRGQGLSSSLESAVTAAASVALHLSQRGFMVRLTTATGEHEATSWHMREATSNARPLLESLAVLTTTSHENDRLQLVERSRSGRRDRGYPGRPEPSRWRRPATDGPILHHRDGAGSRRRRVAPPRASAHRRFRADPTVGFSRVALCRPRPTGPTRVGLAADRRAEPTGTHRWRSSP